MPAELAGAVRRGSVVAVRLGAQTVLGVVLALSATTAHAGRHVNILSVIDVPAVPEELLDLALQVRDHYLSSLGAAWVSLCLPAGSLRLRRVLVPSAAGLAALAAGERGAAGARAYIDGTSGDRPGSRRPRRSACAARAGSCVELPPPRGPRAPSVRVLEAGEGQPARLGARQRAALDYVGRRKVDEATLRGHTGLSRAGLERLLAGDLLRVAGAGSRRGAAGTAPVLLPEQEAALSEILGDVGPRREGAAARRHRQRQDRGLPARRRGGAALGAGVLVLVPEIGLTGRPWPPARGAFPASASRCSTRACRRASAWPPGAAPPRAVPASCWAPARRSSRRIRDLGLIVVDEEHDASYKQDNEPALRRPHRGRLARRA